MNLYAGSDNLIEVIGLRNVATDAFINTATASVRVLDSAGVEVAGETWPVSMPYVTGSSGDYRGTIADTVTLVVGATVQVEVTVDAGPGLKSVAKGPANVLQRGL